MRKVLIAIVVLVLCWPAYWLWAARSVENGIAGWLEARRGEGWVAEATAIETGGFPIRFETQITDLRLADPETGLAWTAPTFGIEAGSASPTRITLIWPSEQVIASPLEPVTIRSEVFTAGLGFPAASDYAVDSVTARLEGVSFEAPGWKAALSSGTFDLTAREGADYDLAFEAREVTLPEGWRRQLDPAGLLPEAMEGLRLSARAGFDRVWDRRAIEERRPQIVTLDLTDMRAQWGEVQLRAAGDLVVDAEGRATGEITVKATNWRAMVGLARNAGLLPEALAPTVERMLEILAALNGPPETIDAPLTFSNGFLRFGPIPLGPAPRLVIR